MLAPPRRRVAHDGLRSLGSFGSVGGIRAEAGVNDGAIEIVKPGMAGLLLSQDVSC